MVVEKVLTDVINKVLGDYFENINQTQLKIALWSGNVLLSSLKLRQTALDDTDLPIRIVYGYIGKLVLKIPWKKIYSQHVVMEAEDLFICVASSASKPYNAEKAAKAAYENKMSMLNSYEESLKEKSVPDMPTFKEKLAAQIIRNLQIKISNVHINYQDNFLWKEPVVWGISLYVLEICTADSEWNKRYIDNNSPIGYKIAKLDSLSAYLNCNPSSNRHVWKHGENANVLKETIANKATRPRNYNYILGPTSTQMKLQLNMSPENDDPQFSVPKCSIILEEEILELNLTSSQSKYITKFLDLWWRNILAAPYREFRPFNIPYAGHAKEWWKYALTAVRDFVHNKYKVWAWSYIKEHRRMCHAYAEALKLRELTQKPSATLLEECRLLEQELDLMNLIIIRQHVRVEIAKLRLQLNEGEGKSRVWYGFFSRPTIVENERIYDMLLKVKTELTESDKEAFYESLGYKIGNKLSELPDSYVSFSLNATLQEACITFYDDTEKTREAMSKDSIQVACLTIHRIHGQCQYRTTAKGLHLTASVGALNLTGLDQGEDLPLPTIIKYTHDKVFNLVDFDYEMNPLDKHCDHKIYITVRTIYFIYDYRTVLHIFNVFEPFDIFNHFNGNPLMLARAEKGQHSATVLKMISDRKLTFDVIVKVMANLILIPKEGYYDQDVSSLVIISLGELWITLSPRPRLDLENINKMIDCKEGDLEYEQFMEAAYNHISINLAKTQVIVAYSSENWANALSKDLTTDMHMLKPMSINADIFLSTLTEFKRLPKYKLNIDVLSLLIQISIDRLIEAINIMTSFPLPLIDLPQEIPKTAIPPKMLVTKIQNALNANSNKRNMSSLATKSTTTNSKASTGGKIQQQPLIFKKVYNNLEAFFILRNFEMKLYHFLTKDEIQNYEKPSDYKIPPAWREHRSTSNKPANVEVAALRAAKSTEDRLKMLVLSISLCSLNVRMLQSTECLIIRVLIDSLQVAQFECTSKGRNRFLILNTIIPDKRSHLLFMEYICADENSQAFQRKFHSIHHKLRLRLSYIELNFNLECLLELLAIAEITQDHLITVVETAAYHHKNWRKQFRLYQDVRLFSLWKYANELFALTPGAQHRGLSISQLLLVPIGSASDKSATKFKDYMFFKFVIDITQMELVLTTRRRDLSRTCMQQLNGRLIKRVASLEICCTLTTIDIQDLNPQTVHRNILKTFGEEALHFAITLYDVDDMREKRLDEAKILIELQPIKIFYLHWFFRNTMLFVNHFQAPIKMLMKAYTAASDAAVQAYDEAKRINLKVDINAPVIVMPADSTSLNAIEIDLGLILITNSVVSFHVRDQGTVWIDNIKIELKNLSIKNSVLDYKKAAPKQKTNAQKCILDPINCLVTITRNLSKSWYKYFAAIEVTATFKLVEFNLLKNDFHTIRSIFYNNFCEGRNDTMKPYHLKVLSRHRAKQAPVAVLRLSKVTDTSTVKQSEEVHIFFEMDGLVVNFLYDQKDYLSRFAIYLVSVKMSQYTNGRMNLNVVVCNIEVQDIRSNSKNLIKQYVSRKDWNTYVKPALRSALEFLRLCRKDRESMFKMQISSKDNLTLVEVNVVGLDFIVNVEFFSEVLKFCMFPTTKKVTSYDSLQDGHEDSISSKLRIINRQGTENKSHVKDIIMNIDQLDVFFVDSLENLNTNTIICSVIATSNYKANNDNIEFNCAIKDLCMYMCVFNPNKRYSTTHYVLRPCRIDVIGNIYPYDVNRIKVNVSYVRLNISPPSIAFIFRTISNLAIPETNVQVTQSKKTDNTMLWHPKEFNDKDYWFLSHIIDDGMGDESLSDSITTINDKAKSEILLDIPSIQVVFEDGWGYYTTPLIQSYLDMRATFITRPKEHQMEGLLKINMDYYNAYPGVWEPVIEKIEVTNPNGSNDYVPWKIKFKALLQNHLKVHTEHLSRRASVEISAEDNMEITVSKTFLNLALNLGEAFSMAVKPYGLSRPKLIAPYRIQNKTGTKMIINFGMGNLTLHDVYFLKSPTTTEFMRHIHIRRDPNDNLECVLSSDGIVFLSFKKRTDRAVLEEQSNKLSVRLELSNTFVEVPVYEITERHFHVRMQNNEYYGFISQVVNEYGTISVKFYSIVSVENHFCKKVNIYQQLDPDSHAKTFVTAIPPNVIKNLPLKAVYSHFNELYFGVENYYITSESFNCFDMLHLEEYSKLMKCAPLDGFEPIFIHVLRSQKFVLSEKPSKKQNAAVYNIQLHPLIMLRNALPISIKVSIAGISVKSNRVDDTDNETMVLNRTVSTMSLRRSIRKSELFSSRDDVYEEYLGGAETEVKPSAQIQLPSLTYFNQNVEDKTFLVVKLIKYLERDWSCTTDIQNRKYTAIWNFSTYDDATRQIDMDLFAHYDDLHGSIKITLYSPIWMINKTGQLLTYSADMITHSTYIKNLYHPPEYTGPILFSYGPKFFGRRKYALVRVGTGDWSARVPLDAVGSMGSINCYDNNKHYKIGVQNHMRHGSLTKKIIFIPFFIAVNRLDAALSLEVINQKKCVSTVDIKSNSYSAIWPSRLSQYKMIIKVGKTSTVPFKFSEETRLLLKLDGHPLGGIYVSIRVNDGGTSLLFSPYQEGNAPGLLINDTSYPVEFNQYGFQKQVLAPGDMIYYTWNDPILNKYLVFGNNRAWVTLDQNSNGEIVLERNKVGYWSTFLFGQQRILLFTESKEYATNYEQQNYFEKITANNLAVRLNGIGLSLVNNHQGCEIAYFGITDSGIIWEYRKLTRKRLKKIQHWHELEVCYQDFLERSAKHEHDIPPYNVANNKEVDFGKMLLTKKKKKSYAIKRTFQPGVYLELSMTEFYRKLHVKLHHVQIDNQLSDPVFSVVLAPMKLAKGVLPTAVPMPFIEFMTIEHTLTNTNITHFQHIGLLVQEFYCHLSVRFLFTLYELFVFKNKHEDAEADWLQYDLNTLDKDVMEFAKVGTTSDKLDYFNYIHLSPIKMHFSFTVENTSSKPMFGLFTLLYGVGVTLTNVNDIVFRLAYFQAEHITFDRMELIHKIIDHYRGQALKQFYVYALGLDVLGNPYGLLYGVKQGVQDFFYEPFKGAVQGPNEFVEGIYYGFKSLFGQTVGGCAGALTRITGSIGRGLAFLTFDNDYTRKRRQLKQMGGIHCTERLIRNSRWLAMSFVDAARNVILLPVMGAHEGHCKGFTIGLCKGVVGLVTRPAAGVFDFISNNSDAIKRLVIARDDDVSLRAARFMHYDHVVRMYCKEYANGFRVLNEIQNGKYAKKELFQHCEFLTPDNVVILTDKRILYVRMNKLFQYWTVQWNYMWDNVVSIKGTLYATNLSVLRNKFCKEQIFVVVIPSPEEYRRHRLQAFCEAQKRGITRQSAPILPLTRYSKYGRYF